MTTGADGTSGDETHRRVTGSDETSGDGTRRGMPGSDEMRRGVTEGRTTLVLYAVSGRIV